MKIKTGILITLISTLISCNHKQKAIECNGYVEIEAENFNVQGLNEDRVWHVHHVGESNFDGPDMEVSHAETASGHSYLEILPQNKTYHGEPFFDYHKDGEMKPQVLSYQVDFNQVGRYYVWVKVYANKMTDSGVNVGIDGQWPESGQNMIWDSNVDEWSWENQKQDAGKASYIDVDKKGVHTISFSFLNNGFEMDKIALSVENKQPIS